MLSSAYMYKKVCLDVYVFVLVLVRYTIIMIVQISLDGSIYLSEDGITSCCFKRFGAIMSVCVSFLELGIFNLHTRRNKRQSIALQITIHL
jgi:hypothetical protein